MRYSIACIWACTGLAVAAPAASQAFGPATPIDANLGEPWCVQTSDVDLDGDLDVLVAARTDDLVGWYENDGSGQFGPLQTVTTEADEVYSFVPADLDGDGDEDLLVASAGDDTVAWHENTGGAFGPRQVISTTVNGARSIVAADLDGDGDLDALVGSMYDDRVSWFENLGAGAFGAQRIITDQAAFVLCVDAADMDGDGDVDVLSASRDDDRIAWHENLGSGGWATHEICPPTALMQSPNFIRAADLDLDGRMDVVASSLEAGVVLRLIQTSGTTFELWGVNSCAGGTGPIAANGFTRPSAFVLADLDDDHDLDLVTSSYGAPISAGSPSSGAIQFFESPCPGAFGSTKAVATGLDRASFAHAADLDGDARLDLLGTTYRDGQLFWYRNLIPQQFETPFWVFEPLTTPQPQGKQIDMDGDGDLDRLNGTLCEENLGGGHYGPPVELRPQSFSLGMDLRWSDIDGDSDLDLVVLRGQYNAPFSEYWGEVWVATNEGLSGRFVPRPTALYDSSGCSTEEYSSLFLIEYQGDGIPDVLVLGESYLAGDYVGAVASISSPGQATADCASVSPTNNLTKLLIAPDLDGSGRDTIFYADFEDFVEVGFTLNGPFGYRSGCGMESTASPVINLQDFDGDGDLDVILRTGDFGGQRGLTEGVELLEIAVNMNGAWAYETLVNVPVPLDDCWCYQDMSLCGEPLRFTADHSRPPSLILDVDGNGAFDLLFEDGWTPGLEGGQLMETLLPFNTPLSLGDLSECTVKDMNGDGRLDIVTPQTAPMGPGYWKNISPRDLNGNGVPDACETIGTRYCSPAVANSTGASGELDVLGSVFIGQNDVTLTARQLPQSSFGFFITSQTPASVNPVANSMGTLCVTGAVGRYVGPGQLVNSGSTGTVALPIDLSAMPTPTGLVAATLFSTWHFQLWHRDGVNGQSTSNFSDAVAVTFQ